MELKHFMHKFLFQSKAVLLHFLPGDVIYKIGDVSNGIYLIITGLAKVQFIALERIKLVNTTFCVVTFLRESYLLRLDNATECSQSVKH